MKFSEATWMDKIIYYTVSVIPSPTECKFV